MVRAAFVSRGSMSNVSGGFIRFFALLPGVLAAACATTGTTAPKSAGGAAKSSAPVYQLADIQALSASEVDDVLGAPSLTRREGSGEYRRYTLSTCSLVVILYPDETGAQKVAHVDATALSSSQEKPDLESCLAAG